MYKSKEELHFSWFLEELMSKGYINKCEYEPKSIILNKPLYIKYLNAKGKELSKKLIPEKVYTFDFLIEWNSTAKNLFYYNIDEITTTDLKTNKLIPAQDNISRIEIKGDFDRNNMIRVAKTNIAVVWDKYNIYIHIIQPYKLFKEMFYPVRFNLTDTTNKARKIGNVLAKTLPKLNEYLIKHNDTI